MFYFNSHKNNSIVKYEKNYEVKFNILQTYNNKFIILFKIDLLENIFKILF